MNNRGIGHCLLQGSITAFRIKDKPWTAMLRIDIISVEIRTITTRIRMLSVSSVGTPVTLSKQWSPIADVSLSDNPSVTLRKDTRCPIQCPRPFTSPRMPKADRLAYAALKNCISIHAVGCCDHVLDQWFGAKSFTIVDRCHFVFWIIQQCSGFQVEIYGSRTQPLKKADFLNSLFLEVKSKVFFLPWSGRGSQTSAVPYS